MCLALGVVSGKEPESVMSIYFWHFFFLACSNLIIDRFSGFCHLFSLHCSKNILLAKFSDHITVVGAISPVAKKFKIRAFDVLKSVPPPATGSLLDSVLSCAHGT